MAKVSDFSDGSDHYQYLYNPVNIRIFMKSNYGTQFALNFIKDQRNTNGEVMPIILTWLKSKFKYR